MRLSPRGVFFTIWLPCATAIAGSWLYPAISPWAWIGIMVALLLIAAQVSGLYCDFRAVRAIAWHASDEIGRMDGPARRYGTVYRKRAFPPRLVWAVAAYDSSGKIWMGWTAFSDKIPSPEQLRRRSLRYRQIA